MLPHYHCEHSRPSVTGGYHDFKLRHLHFRLCTDVLVSGPESPCTHTYTAQLQCNSRSNGRWMVFQKEDGKLECGISFLWMHFWSPLNEHIYFFCENNLFCCEFGKWGESWKTNSFDLFEFNYFSGKGMDFKCIDGNSCKGLRYTGIWKVERVTVSAKTSFTPSRMHFKLALCNVSEQGRIADTRAN